jgi:hypothetical protein
MRLTKLALGMLAIGVWVGPNTLYAQYQAIDVNRSSLTIRVFKSGMFSAFAHDHEIRAAIDEGWIDSSANPSVQLRLDSRKMRVLDPDISVHNRRDTTYDGRHCGPRCRAVYRDFLPFHRYNQNCG